MDVEQSRSYNDSLLTYSLFFPDSNLNDRLNDCLALATQFSGNYLWQNDPFRLRCLEKGSDEVPCPHLHGSTDYGENVGDLWFITYILKRLTLELNGLVVKVQDSDGEFLLIEAADDLPKWVNPESATNRVYLYNGDVHIIPQASNPGEITPLATGVPTVEAAVACVRACSSVTRASDSIQAAILKRLKKYPEQALRDMHTATCYLPLPAAKVLAQQPQLISSATRAFYHRDPLDLKACQKMKYFPAEKRVCVKVQLTRCLYAQLMQQKFFPPKRSSWDIPPLKDPKHKSYDIGMKIAFGFEMLCAGAQPDDSTETFDGIKWTRYLSSLHKYNYFQGEIEGSIKYKQLYSQAKQYFSANQELSSPDQSSRSGVGDKILRILAESKITEEELREKEKHLTADDDDSWLYMTYAELDQMLEDYSSKPLADFDSKPADFHPTQLTDSMSAFINKQSNILSGAEVPSSEELKFDGKGFLAAIEQMMNGGDNEVDSDDSSLDEYESDDSLSEDHTQPGARHRPPAQQQKNVSFDKTAPQAQASKESDKQKEPKIEDFMDMMDRELSKTHVGKSFERQQVKGAASADKVDKQEQATLAVEEDFSDDEDLQPVDVDLNTVKNLLESYNQQMGLPGPTSNLLESMGLKLPQNADE